MKHPTFYETVIHNPLWDKWVKQNEKNPKFDVHESADNYFSSLKLNTNILLSRKDPKIVIAWAKREIAEYQKLIRLMEKEMAKKKKK